MTLTTAGTAGLKKISKRSQTVTLNVRLVFEYFVWMNFSFCYHMSARPRLWFVMDKRAPRGNVPLGEMFPQDKRAPGRNVPPRQTRPREKCSPKTNVPPGEMFAQDKCAARRNVPPRQTCPRDKCAPGRKVPPRQTFPREKCSPRDKDDVRRSLEHCTEVDRFSAEKHILAEVLPFS